MNRWLALYLVWFNKTNKLFVDMMREETILRTTAKIPCNNNKAMRNLQ